MSKFNLNQQIKRIKIVFGFAKKIIHEFGLSYFLSVCVKELRNNGFGVFKTEFSNKVELNDELLSQQNYHSWLKTKLPVYKKQIQNSKSENSFLFILQLPPNFYISILRKTIISLQIQQHKNWKLYIFSNDKTILNHMDVDDNIFVKTNNDILTINSFITDSNSDFVGFLNSGDELKFNALSEFQSFFVSTNSDLLYSDHDEISNSNEYVNPFFKPDWSPYLILSLNYVGLFVMRKKLFTEFTKVNFDLFDGGLYDLLLQVYEKSKIISHIPIPLISYGYISKKSLDMNNHTKKIITDFLKRKNIPASVKKGAIPKTLKISYPIITKPKISIIIPTKDSKSLLERCIRGIEEKTSYKNWEIIVVDNNSIKDETKNYLKSLKHKVISFTENYNFSKINNIASNYCSGDFLLFMNDDISVLDDHPNWLNELVTLCSQPNVAIVGPKLLFSNNTIQSAGSVFLKTGAGFHPYMRKPSNYSGNFGLANVIREYSAVTASCMIIKKEIFNLIGKYDEDLDLYYGDSDLCLKSRKLGFQVLYTPFSVLLHEGSSTTTRESKSFFAVENHFWFMKKYPFLQNGDPYYNLNLDFDYRLPNTKDT